MINPKSLVSALHSHWEVMIALTTLSREYPAFSSEMVLEEIAKAHTTKNQEEHEALLRQLIGTELLSLHSRSNTLEIHPLVQEFVRGLMREHELGLSEVLRVRVSAIKDTTNSLVDGLQSMKMEQIVSACRKLNELFRQIAQQLDQDRHAIHEIAERAKTAGGGIPVSRRYREVIEAYDQYILPMTEMMDSGPTGTFSAHMDKAIRTLEGGREKLLIQGALYRHQEQLNLVNGQAKELQRQGRLILKECSDTLLPLRDELRQHNTLSQSISYLLGQIRKRGLNKTLPEASLPLWQRDSERQIRINDKLLDYMAGAMCFTPQETPFPNDAPGDMPAPSDLINERELREILASDLPVADLLQWLHKRHPDLQDVTLLRLYHTLIHEDQHWTAYQSDRQQEYALTTVRITHYPHGLITARSESPHE